MSSCKNDVSPYCLICRRGGQSEKIYLSHSNIAICPTIEEFPFLGNLANPVDGSTYNILPRVRPLKVTATTRPSWDSDEEDSN